VSTSRANSQPGVSAQGGTAAEGTLTHREILVILSGLMLAMFLAALDQNIVATAIRTIGDQLHGLDVQAWVTTSFLITSTVTTLLYGKLGDIYGRKPLFLSAITLFILGSALCGLSTSMYMLAAFRAFQGLGAGGLFSIALAIMADVVSPQERPKYMGYFMAMFAISSVLGPVAGGFLSGQSSILGIDGWRWIFYVNVPFGIAALVVVTKFLHVEQIRRSARIDWWGSLTVAVALVPLLIVAEQGHGWGWSSPRSVACLVVGIGGVVAFYFAERAAGDAALVPLRLFNNRGFSIGAAQLAFVGIGMFGAFSSIPLYLQIVKGASPMRAGLLLLPLVVGLMLSATISGRLITKTGKYKIYPILGSVALVLALFGMSRVGVDTPLWLTDVFMALFGAGLGLNMQTIQLAMQNSAPIRDLGVATAAGTFFRQVGGTLGAAVFLSILFSTAPTRIAENFAKAQSDPAFIAAKTEHPDQWDLIQQHSGGLVDTSFLNGLDTRLTRPFMTGFSSSMDLVFVVGTIVMLVTIALVAFLPEVPLRRMSGAQAAATEAATEAAKAEAAREAAEGESAKEQAEAIDAAVIP